MQSQNKIDLVAAEMRARVNKLKLESTISSYERTQMGLLATRLSENLPYGDDSEIARLEWMLIFLEGDFDWKNKYKEVFGSALKEPKKKQDMKFPKPRFETRSEMA